ncbi:hypothetical protein FND55_10090 [Lactobacillus paracasei subsp. paracasei]|uniref:hypothetical protein n=1 Tax=Lacticaseibacillus paracasei TaxID=1597 RepID=UPI001E3005F7|nr:hypothetical protein [Lacticaseibacillus paracasei]MBG1273956.1 hypothetical protein [Lacticaseibacillus paracasei subsp. paracasei]
MSNETKRDVFNQVAGELNAFLATMDDGGYYHRYDNALPDDLPTIPLAVSEQIRQDYGKTTLFDELAWAFQDSFDNSEVNEWITNNEDIFGEAWCRGLWIVEETGEAASYDE